MNYRYKLDESSKKFICPNCGKKRLVKFIDEAGNYLPSEFGRCDRATNCGYFKKPDNNIDDQPMTIPFSPKPKLPTSYIERSIFEATMQQYEKNSLFQYLSKIYDEKAVYDVFKKYHVGTANVWGGSTVFWQTDINQQFRSGKIMKYDDKTGSRIKDPKPLITWVHSLLKRDPFNLEQVLFGEHLINNDENEEVYCIVESEKTAIVCALECPQFTWLATSSLQMFKSDNFKTLANRNIIAFPDTDAHEIWIEKATEIESKLKTPVIVSNLLINGTIAQEGNKGLDLADLLSSNNVSSDDIESEVQQVLKRMIDKNPAVQTMIDKFGLDTKNAKLIRKDSH